MNLFLINELYLILSFSSVIINIEIIKITAVSMPGEQTCTICQFTVFPMSLASV